MAANSARARSGGLRLLAETDKQLPKRKNRGITSPVFQGLRLSYGFMSRKNEFPGPMVTVTLLFTTPGTGCQAVAGSVAEDWSVKPVTSCGQEMVMLLPERLTASCGEVGGGGPALTGIPYLVPR